MRTKLLSLLILLLLAGSLLPAGLTGVPAAQATAYHAIAIDGDLSDWAADEDMEADGAYGLYLTWDASSLYLGLTGATLGDTSGQDKSFYACFDTDQTAGSGAAADGYSNVAFNVALFAPEYCYYFAGGSGWYEWSTWSGTAWTWNGWRNDGTYYNWPGNTAPIPGSELTILRSDIGSPSALRVVAWLTPEESGALDASWPTANPTGAVPTLPLFYHLPALSDGVSPDRSRLANHVVANEFAPKGTEWVEIYNPTAAAVSLQGWYADDAACGTGTSVIGAVTLDPGATYVIDASQPGDNFTFDNSGGTMYLCDASHNEVDQAGYGYLGGAPISHAQSGINNTTARTPNGTDTDDPARDWNVATTPTKNAPNTAPAVLLGSSLTINEVEYAGSSASSRVELYNPTAEAIDLNGWLFSDGDRPPWAIITTTTTLLPGEVYFFPYSDLNNGGIGGTDVSYLFTPTGIRVDQLGWNGVTLVNSAQRICDGEGPNDGYNWATSGGGSTLLDLPQTYGALNCLPDAGIAKAGPGYVGIGGGNVDYLLTYEMTSGAGGSNIVITDTLPSGVTYVSFDSILPVTLTNTDPVVFDAGDLAGQGSNVITLTANVPSGLAYGTRLTNTVTIACDGDANASNDEAEWVTIVVGSETGIAKAGPDFALPGQAIAYTLTYTVEGDPAQGVVITDTLPADVTYVGDNAPVIPTEPTPGTWVWDLGTVAAGTNFFVVQGLVSSAPLTWTLHNEAAIASTNDTDPGNNQATWDTNTPLPIQEIQYTTEPGDGTYPSLRDGQDVWTLGAVIADESTFGSPNYRIFIQDPAGDGPWDGILLYYGGATAPDVNVGDLLLVYGTVDEYGGVTELATTAADTTVLQTGVPVTSTAIPTADLIDGIVAESYESVLVEFNCALVTNPDLGYGEWGVTDSSGEEAAVDDWATYAYSPTLGDSLAMVRGVVNYYVNWKLAPRGDADIVLGLGLVSAGPADGAVDVPVNTVVTATFSAALDPATVTPATFYLEGVSGTVSYDPGSWTATFTPDADLAYGTTYTAHATTGIESADGAPLCDEYAWSFTTAELPAPDLRDSSKLASLSQVPVGGTFTYTIRLLNTGDLTASAVLTDVLPAEVTVLTPTLPPGMVYVGGQLLWSGEVYPNQAPILLPFQVQVNPDVPTGSTIVNVVWIDDGVHLFTRTVSVEVTGAPDIVVMPDAFSVILAPDQNTTRDLTIANQGDAILSWMLSEVPPVDWLSEDLTAGQVPAGGQTGVVVTFDAAGLAVGSYDTVLDIYSSDPDEPHVYVDVTLVVTTSCVPVDTADFSWLPASPLVGEAITFEAGANGSEPITYAWAFGDGATGTGQIVQHTYTVSDTYTVVLTATNACGEASISHTVVVTGEPGQVWQVFLPVVMRGGGR